MKEEYIDLFDAFLDKALSADEEQGFQQKLLDDASLAKAFQDYLKVQQLIAQKKRSELKSNLIALDSELNKEIQEQLSVEEFEEPIKRSLVFKWLAAAAVLLMLAATWNYYKEQGTINTEDYWLLEPGLPVKMSANHRFDQAMNAYKLEEFDKAEALLLSIPSDTSDYFLGQVYHHKGASEKALEHFEKVVSSSVFHQKAQYYSALLLLEKGNLDEAKKGLIQIEEQPMLSKAEALLKLLDHQ